MSVVGGLVVLVLVAGGLVVLTVQRSFPQLDGELSVEGLDANVTVYRDDAGIPVIEAESATDLFAAQGFVHAQDRFWEMDFRRHVTSGRLAELFGEAQVETDTFVRTLGWRAVAEQEVELLDPLTLSWYQAYADGVNAYLAEREGASLSLEYAVLGLQNPGYEPEKWTPADSVAWLKAMAWDLRSNLEDEIDRAILATSVSPEQLSTLYPTYPYETNPTVLSAMATPFGEAAEDAPAEQQASVDSLLALRDVVEGMPALLGRAGSDIGSNSWVVAGSLTESGKPLLANDPHLGPSLPSVWYQMGLRCSVVSAECPFDVAGFSFSGMPGIIIGHNARVAWGFTNLGPDTADLYIEKVAEANYELDGVLRPLTVREEVVKVAGGEDVPITIRSTERGPLVTGVTGDFSSIAADYPASSGLPEGSYELSLQWTALTPGQTPRAIFAVNQATDWASFREGARLFEVPSQNLVYADVDGNIGYQAPGLIPVRSAGDGTVPQPGWTSASGWKSYIPFEALPSQYNPESGYIVTANNAVVNSTYPYLITRDWDAGYRADRITDRIRTDVDAGTKFTAATMSEIQADNHNAIGEAFAPYLADLTPSGNAKKGATLLADWDFADDADSAESAYFNIFWRTLLNDSFSPKLPEAIPASGGGQWFQIVSGLLDDPASSWWVSADDNVTGRDEAITHALGAAWTEAEDLMGDNPEDWTWGELHTLTIRNASFGESGIAPIEWLFNRGPYELAGGSSVVNAVGWYAPDGYTVDWVPSMRQVVDLADFDGSTWINLGGASGHAFAPTYVDQTVLWQENKTRTWAYSPDAVDSAATDVLTLTP
ncbi:penicillin acylase family protein [Mycetocola zhujimingii]|uniref:Penicillin acylase family protein n=1 Tax=Mycetocola zhujimingii TaxID=2079792 RepID=A0A2U1THU4_9MICO|nr:penicillin acylase family protein [Mycetocola zhujimingii]PWC08426.1 penicillin acylase family protein [Mycetocola zhujimingii]